MHQSFVKLTVEVTSVSDRLTGDYRPKDLHRLRISIRRIRSLLKQVSDRNARHFRKTWGGFAAVTNQAAFRKTSQSRAWLVTAAKPPQVL